MLPEDYPAFRRTLPAAIFAAVFAISLSLPLAARSQTLTPDQTGRWTPDATWAANEPAIHMALLPGHTLGGTSYHSEVLWWNGEDLAAQNIGLWGWSPHDDDCSAYPSASFTNLNSLMSNPVDANGHPVNIFCAGHAQMSNGRLLIAGGTQDDTDNGIRQFQIFDPTTGNWTTAAPPGPDSMAYARWYPTLTALQDGRVLASSGLMYTELELFGGLTNAATLPSDNAIYRFDGWGNGVWQSPLQAPGGGVPWPSPRDHFSAVPAPHYGAEIFFGGHTAIGYSNEAWFLYRNPNPTAADFHYDWTPMPTTSPQPSGRFEHAAAMLKPGDSTMVFLGGSDGSNAFSDIWSLQPNHGLPSSPPFAWIQAATVLGDPTYGTPGARLGHTIISDESHQRLLMFGGAPSIGGAPSDNKVWALTLSQDRMTAQWSVPTDLSTNHPSARYDFTLTGPIADKSGPSGASESAILFGGHTASGYSNELWRLFVHDATGAIEWRLESHSGTPPSPRAGHAANWDGSAARLYVFGGTSPVGSLDDTMYAAVMDVRNNPAAQTSWWPVARRGTGSALGATGHSMLFKDATLARISEAYDPARNVWASLAAAPLLEPSYPQHFVVPATSDSAYVFAAGPDNVSRLLSVDQPAWKVFPSTGNSFAPYTSAMYRPGMVLAAGGTTGGSTVVGNTTWIDLNPGASSQWTGSYNTMLPRYYHNLTLLPTGQVLVTGGRTVAFESNDVNTAQKRIEIWTPDVAGGAGAWHGRDTLAQDQHVRGYHTTALLLPDGRVLCAGGTTESPDYAKEDLFCPPYLFNADGTPATRPTITTAPDTVIYGKVFTICTPTPSSIGSACLLKPGAVTHGFNQDQRYVPLPIVPCAGGLYATAPAGSALAPPGDYLLFIVSTSGTPSIAKWVKLGPPGLDRCDVAAPEAIGLSFTVDPNDCTLFHLHWTAPSDDAGLPASGAVTDYNMKASTISFSDDWTGGLMLGQPPASPGAADGTDVTVGENGSTYIRIKALDDNNNYAGISNQIHIRGPRWNDDCLGGGMIAGGGGGGAALQSAGGTTSLEPALEPTSGLSVTGAENSVLNGVPTGSKGEDVYRLAGLTVGTDGRVAPYLRQTQGHAAALDRAQLLAVDHGDDASAYRVAGAFVLGARHAATHITAGDGSDITTFLNGSSGYGIGAGDTLSVDLGPGGGDSPLIVAGSGWGSLILLVPDGQGSWRQAGSASPRRAPDELALAAPGVDAFRLTCTGTASLTFIGRLSVSPERSTVQAATLLSGQDTRLGDVKMAVAAGDSVTATLVGPDTLTLVYSVPTPMAGAARDYFLVVNATPLDPLTLTTLALQQAREDLPVRFALRQNQPNPFTATTKIHFDLPVGAMVRLEVFDAQGRRIETLANRYFPAGYQSVSWNPAASASRAGPGVYFYRIAAGPFRDRKKMVLLAR